MRDHIDIDAGGVLLGHLTIDQVAQKIYDALLTVGSGKAVRAERLKYDQTVEIYTTGPTV
jgi:altronate dehydratase